MSADREMLPRTFLVGAGTLVSRALGLVREMITAPLLGTSGLLDLFLMAFMLPNLFRRLFGEGALRAAFLPLFARATEESPEEADRFFRTVMTALAALLGALVGIGWIGCGVAALSGGLTERGRLFCLLLALMLPYLPLICLSALAGAALNARERFFVPAMAPALLNVCWILALALFGRRYDVRALAVGVLVAGVLQLGVLIPSLRRSGLSLRPIWDFGHARLRRMVGLMAPVALGIGAVQVNVMADRLIAYFCVPGDGAVSALHYGNRLMQFPLAVLGMALATAVFPSFATQAARGQREALARTVNTALRTTVFLALPCMAVLLALGDPIVRLLFERNAFTALSTARTTRILTFYALGLWAFSAIHVVARAFYAMEDMRAPVRVACWMVGANVALNLILVWPMREAGLALASSLTACGNLFWLLIRLRTRMGPLGARRALVGAAKGVAAAAFAGTAAYYGWLGAAALLAGKGELSPARAIGALAVGLLLAGGVFALASWGLRAREFAELAAAFGRRT